LAEAIHNVLVPGKPPESASGAAPGAADQPGRRTVVVCGPAGHQLEPVKPAVTKSRTRRTHRPTPARATDPTSNPPQACRPVLQTPAPADSKTGWHLPRHSPWLDEDALSAKKRRNGTPRPETTNLPDLAPIFRKDEKTPDTSAAGSEQPAGKTRYQHRKTNLGRDDAVLQV
jgi:hypothetical protein